jgi:hypothetical protein
VIILCVRWYLRNKLSLRDLVEMMAERGLSLAHTIHPLGCNMPFSWACEHIERKGNPNGGHLHSVRGTVPIASLSTSYQLKSTLAAMSKFGLAEDTRGHAHRKRSDGSDNLEYLREGPVSRSRTHYAIAQYANPFDFQFDGIAG